MIKGYYKRINIKLNMCLCTNIYPCFYHLSTHQCIGFIIPEKSFKFIFQLIFLITSSVFPASDFKVIYILDDQKNFNLDYWIMKNIFNISKLDFFVVAIVTYLFDNREGDMNFKNK